MNNAAHQYGQTAAQMSFLHSDNLANTTSTLRQFRKKEAYHQVAQPQDSQPCENVARVAPHNHFPPVYHRPSAANPANGVFTGGGYGSAPYMQDYGRMPVKYSEISEHPPHPHHSDVNLMNPLMLKQKTCMEIMPQTHDMHPHPHAHHHAAQQAHAHQMGGAYHAHPTPPTAQPMPQQQQVLKQHNSPESQYYKEHNLQQQYAVGNSTAMNNMSIKYARKYQPHADNDFFTQLQKAHPSMARSIMSDHQMYNTSAQNMQSNRYYNGYYPNYNYRNYNQYAPEYAQHYQFRKQQQQQQQQQEYYALQQCQRTGQYQGAPPQDSTDQRITPSNDLKQFIENWADDEAGPANNTATPLVTTPSDTPPTKDPTVFLVEDNQLQYVTIDNVQYVVKNGLLEPTNNNLNNNNNNNNTIGSAGHNNLNTNTVITSNNNNTNISNSSVSPVSANTKVDKICSPIRVQEQSPETPVPNQGSPSEDSEEGSTLKLDMPVIDLLLNAQESQETEDEADKSPTRRKKRIFSIDSIMNNDIGQRKDEAEKMRRRTLHLTQKFIDAERRHSIDAPLASSAHAQVEEITSTESACVEYRNALKIEEDSVLLHIGGQLVEINVTEQNGKKVITVVPIDSDINDENNDEEEETKNDVSDEVKDTIEEAKDAIQEVKDDVSIDTNDITVTEVQEAMETVDDLDLAAMETVIDGDVTDDVDQLLTVAQDTVTETTETNEPNEADLIKDSDKDEETEQISPETDSSTAATDSKPAEVVKPGKSIDDLCLKLRRTKQSTAQDGDQVKDSQSAIKSVKSASKVAKTVRFKLDGKQERQSDRKSQLKLKRKSKSGHKSDRKVSVDDSVLKNGKKVPEAVTKVKKCEEIVESSKDSIEADTIVKETATKTIDCNTCVTKAVEETKELVIEAKETKDSALEIKESAFDTKESVLETKDSVSEPMDSILETKDSRKAPEAVIEEVKSIQEPLEAILQSQQPNLIEEPLDIVKNVVESEKHQEPLETVQEPVENVQVPLESVKPVPDCINPAPPSVKSVSECVKPDPETVKSEVDREILKLAQEPIEEHLVPLGVDHDATASVRASSDLTKPLAGKSDLVSKPYKTMEVKELEPKLIRKRKRMEDCLETEEIIIGDESLELEVEMDLRNDQKQSEVVTKAAKKSYEDVSAVKLTDEASEKKDDEEEFVCFKELVRARKLRKLQKQKQTASVETTDKPEPEPEPQPEPEPESKTKKLSLEDYNERRRKSLTSNDWEVESPQPQLEEGEISEQEPEPLPLPEPEPEPVEPQKDSLELYKEAVCSKIGSLLNIPKNIPKKSQTLRHQIQSLESKIDNFSLTPKDVQENHILMTRFLNKHMLNDHEMRKIKQIIQYKRMVQHLKKLKTLEAGGSYEVQSPAPQDNLKLHLKKLPEQSKAKNSRFRMYDPDSSSSSSSEDEDKRRIVPMCDYSVVAQQCHLPGVPKLIIKRKVDMPQAVVRLERLDMNMYKKKRKWY